LKRISSLLLGAKPWQLFVVSSFLAVAELWTLKLHSFGTFDAYRMGLLRGVTSALELGFVFFWAWSAGTFLNSLLEPSLRFQKPFFYFSLVYPVLYLVLNPELFAIHHPIPTWLRIVLGGSSFICTIFVASAVARSLVSVETGKPSTFSAFAGEFFAIWFFPIGVWFVQPKVNRQFEKRNGPTPSVSLPRNATALPG
jgi:hypothetical protein